MNKELCFGLIRHLLTAAFSYLTAKGLADGATSEQAIGAVLTLCNVGWFIYAKTKTPTKGPQNEVVP